MATISNIKRLAGQSTAEPAVSGNGGAVASVILEFEGGGGVGDVSYEMDVAGVLANVTLNPDDSIAPDAGWAISIKNAAGIEVYSLTGSDTDDEDSGAIAKPVAGTITVDISGLGASDLGRAKAVLTFADSVSLTVAAAHTHTMSDVTGLTAALAAKLDKELDPTPDSDHSFSGPSVTLTAGEDLVFPDCVYPKSDSKMGKADADAAATAPVVAMASATIANNATGVFILPGSFVRDDTWNWTPGGYIYLDTTAGALTQTAPSGEDDVVQVVGWAYTADIMFFNPSLVTVVVTA